MSYCRWSSDNMKSDVYAYEDCSGGYTIHIRNSHPINAEILPDFPKEITGENVLRWHNERRKVIDDLIYKPIGLDYDGQTVVCSEIEDLHRTLVCLRDIGYYVPDVAFDMIEEEIVDDQ